MNWLQIVKMMGLVAMSLLIIFPVVESIPTPGNGYVQINHDKTSLRILRSLTDQESRAVNLRFIIDINPEDIDRIVIDTATFDFFRSDGDIVMPMTRLTETLDINIYEEDRDQGLVLQRNLISAYECDCSLSDDFDLMVETTLEFTIYTLSASVLTYKESGSAYFEYTGNDFEGYYLRGMTQGHFVEQLYDSSGTKVHEQSREYDQSLNPEILMYLPMLLVPSLIMIGRVIYQKIDQKQGGEF